MDESERKRRQRTARDKQFSDIERSLASATRLIVESRREIQRSQGLLRHRREQDAWVAENAADGS